MNTRIFTNEHPNTLFLKFKGFFADCKEANIPIRHFDILVGYFRASGYFKLREHLDAIPHIRILVGINVDELTKKYAEKGKLYLGQGDDIKKNFIDTLTKDIQEASYNKEVEEGIRQFIADIGSGKIQIRASKEKKLHAKVYILRPSHFTKNTLATMITGSSNLTEQGLGTHEKPNYEFNVELREYVDVKFATDEFERLWSDEHSTEVLPVDIKNLTKKTFLNDEITPFEVYIKLLIEYFGKTIEYDESILDYLPEGYDKLAYQADAVSSGFDKLMKYNGFFLADVVGLGKTIVAASTAKKYLQHNGSNTKILVVYPPALESNWKETFDNFKLKRYTDFVSNGSLHKIIEGHSDYYKPEDYDLIIVDESHKFRSETSAMYNLLQLICKTPRKNLGNDKSRKKRVILVSATPLNNKPDDIANQLYLFQDARQSNIEGVPNLQTFFADIIRSFKDIKKELRELQKHRSKKTKTMAEIEAKEKEQLGALREIYRKIRDSILQQVVIRRTRTDIENNEFYKQEMKGVKFPSLHEPKEIGYVLDADLNQLFYDTVDALTDKLGYFRYRAIEFLEPTLSERYDNAERISAQLAYIMKTLLVKRLESSFEAFKQSIKRFKERTGYMIQMFENDKIYIAPDIDVNQYFEQEDEDSLVALEEKIAELHQKNANNDIFKAKDFVRKKNAKKDDIEENLLEGLKQDYDLLEQLAERWEAVSFDAKLQTFLDSLEGELLGKHNISKKLVVFTESIETADYLFQNLPTSYQERTLVINSQNRKDKFRAIQANFDAKHTAELQRNDYDFIITTDVLAEGINLHRAHVIVNYDVPWNATRLMQRIGRVNRLGTKANDIWVYNFFPSAEGDDQIFLNKTALVKLQGFHSAFGEDSKIYTVMEELENNTLGSALEGNQTDTDKRLEYLTFLRLFRKENPKEFERIRKLPMRVRTFRQSKQEGTLGYLRTTKRDAFYWATESATKELTFLEAVAMFEAQKSEQPTAMYEKHHEQVERMAQHFYKNIALASDDDAPTENISVQEQNALELLNALINTHGVNALIDDNLLKLLKTAKKVVYMGIFRLLRNRLAKLNKKRKDKKKPMDLSDVVSEMHKVLQEFPIAQIQRLDELRFEEEEAEKQIQSIPQIIISESFVPTSI